MGTSTSSGGARGNGTPIIPTWIDDVELDPGSEDDTKYPRSSEPDPGEPNRFIASRSAFSRFARSGGTSRSNLGRAISSYVSHSADGSKNAAKRMGSSRISASRLAGFLNEVSSSGVNEALKSLSLASLAGQSLKDVFDGLVDYICPEGGTDDVGIARNAFVETIADLELEGITDLENLTNEQINTIFEMFIAHSIKLRIINDIGARMVTLPDSVVDVDVQFHEFIRNGVSDAISDMGDEIRSITQGGVQRFVDGVYEKAFAMLDAMGESAAEGEL